MTTKNKIIVLSVFEFVVTAVIISLLVLEELLFYILEGIFIPIWFIAYYWICKLCKNYNQENIKFVDDSKDIRRRYVLSLVIGSIVAGILIAA